MSDTDELSARRAAERARRVAEDTQAACAHDSELRIEVCTRAIFCMECTAQLDPFDVVRMLAQRLGSTDQGTEPTWL